MHLTISLLMYVANKISSIPYLDHTSFLKSQNKLSIFLYPTDECEIDVTITDVKSSTSAGHDGLSSDILKAVAHNVVKPL